MIGLIIKIAKHKTRYMKHLTHRAREYSSPVFRFPGGNQSAQFHRKKPTDHRDANHCRKTASERRIARRQLLQPTGSTPLKMPIIIATPAMMKIITVATLINGTSTPPRQNRVRKCRTGKKWRRDSCAQIQPGVSGNHQPSPIARQRVNGDSHRPVVPVVQPSARNQSLP